MPQMFLQLQKDMGLWDCEDREGDRRIQSNQGGAPASRTHVIWGAECPSPVRPAGGALVHSGSRLCGWLGYAPFQC